MADAKARITYNFDTWDAGTITSSTEANSDLADDNVVNDFVSKPWRTSADTGEWWKIDLGSAVNITCIGIFGHNLTAGATVTLEAHATDSFGSPTYSQALTIQTNADSVVRPWIVFYLNETFRWWRITFEDGSNSDTYIEIGVIKAGAYYEFVRNFADQFGIPWVDPSEGDVVEGRQNNFRSRKRYRRAEIEVPMHNDTQRRKFEAIFEKIGREKPCILGLDPTNFPSEMSMFCYLRTPLQLAHALTNFYNSRFTFSEVTE